MSDNNTLDGCRVVCDILGVDEVKLEIYTANLRRRDEETEKIVIPITKLLLGKYLSTGALAWTRLEGGIIALVQKSESSNIFYR